MSSGSVIKNQNWEEMWSNYWMMYGATCGLNTNCWFSGTFIHNRLYSPKQNNNNQQAACCGWKCFINERGESRMTSLVQCDRKATVCEIATLCQFFTEAHLWIGHINRWSIGQQQMAIFPPRFPSPGTIPGYRWPLILPKTGLDVTWSDLLALTEIEVPQTMNLNSNQQVIWDVSKEI